MSDIHLKKLLKLAGGIRMSQADREQQRRSFAYGNTNIENPNVTRETVDRAAKNLEEDGSEGGSA